MKRNRSLMILVGAVLILIVSYLIWDGYTSGDKQDIDQKAQQYQDDLKRITEQSKVTDDKQITERNPYEHKHEDGVTLPENDVTYMFTAAKANDVEGFYDSFTADAILASFPDPNTMRTQMVEYLQVITQNGKLKDIGILEKRVVDEDPENMKVDVTIALLYEGISRKQITLQVQRFQDEHGSQSWKTITLVTNIIEQIKGK
ncbi:hypothetical protein P9G84_31200 [Brevibacillus centrosporus]|uniref:hypothetical protein n=1 Tax=Brevibacillus centrosporus TaxID=54910 RepID=UPI00114323E1|nr:hypothetical protein [Brevibacillus centrosporus]MEC2133325.1 hypothetical protein [Brevibacillus centrosporus]